VSDADTKADVARGDPKDFPPLSSSNQIGHSIKWKRVKRHRALLHQAGHLLLGLVSVATVTGLYFWLDVSLVATASTYLVVLVLLSLVSNLSSLIILSFIGVGCLSYFFAPPIYSFRVDYIQDLITISAFVITSFVNILVTRVRNANQRLKITNKALRIENVERKRAEQAQRESEYKLRQIIETGPSLIWSAGSEGKKAEVQPGFMAQVQAVLNVLPAYVWYGTPSGSLTFVNKRQADFLGIPKDHPLRFGIDTGAQWDDWIPFLHPDEQEEGRKYWSNCLRTGKGDEHYYRVRDAQGNYRWFLTRAEPLRASDGTLLLWIGTTLEIEELKRAEQALREREAKIRRLVDANIIGIFIWDFDGRILEANEAFLHIVGYDHEDLVEGRIRWTDLTPPEWRDDDARLIQEHMKSGSLQPFEKEYFRKDGSRVPVLIGVATFEEGGDQGVAFVLDLTERKRAEEALQRSQFYLGEGQRIARIGSWGFNPSGFFDHWSRELFRIYGLDPQKGAPTLEQYLATIHPLDRDSMAETIRRMHAERCGCDVKKRIVLPDGELRYIRCVGIPVIEGEVLKGFLGTAIDITEQELLTQELRTSEGRFRDYAETASDWFWEIGPDYKFTLLTENAFGSHSADRIGTACWDHALDLETDPEKWRLIQATLDSREPFRDFVYRGLSGNGSPMYVRASGKPMFDANGEFRGYRGTGTDVTEIMRAQEALRESERSARSAFDGIAGLVSILAPNGEVEAANRQFLEYFGSLEWVKNWETNDAVHPEDFPHIAELFKRAIAAGVPFQHELRLRRFDGEYRWFENRGVPIRDDSGHIVRWYVLLTDIEDRTRALAQVEQMQSDFAHMNRVSMMGELAASLSHEIMQPIASARNNARAAQNFLDKQPTDLGEVREALSCVVGDTDRAGDIVDRIRDHIKKAPPRKDCFDLNEAINEVLVLGQSAINKNGVSVQTRLAEGLFPVRGDRVQLQQVILNLLLNACEAMGSSDLGARNLSISTEQNHTGVRVAVRDSGPGIDPTHFDRVFEAFYTTKSNGVGMGLSICRSIIEDHGGRLWAEANEPRGAAFQFSLPAQVKS
jgi:PAS domain S-box-containing protein